MYIHTWTLISILRLLCAAGSHARHAAESNRLPQTAALCNERWLATTGPSAQSPREVMVLLVTSTCCRVELEDSISESTNAPPSCVENEC